MNKNNNRRFKSKPNKNADRIDENNPILCEFLKMRDIIDEKNDRYERIIKISRDITIESKRIIFLLHTADINKENYEQILSDAKERLYTLCSTHFCTIAKELMGRDPYQYTRAFSAGLQEFIEAFTFYEYISGNKFSDWEFLQGILTYQVEEPKKDVAIDLNVEADDQLEVLKIEEEKPVVKTVQCLIQPMEFMLGLGDMTGEVMRRCVNALGGGNVDICFESCKCIQDIYKGFLGIGPTWNKDMSRKISTLRQSMLKSEMVCYNIKVRGTEAAKWGATATDANCEDDEGFY